MREYIVLDLETRESFQEVGSWKPDALTISLVGVLDARTRQERTYRVEELDALESLLAERPTVVGYNILGFDYSVLAAALGRLAAAEGRPEFNLSTLHTIDLFDHLQRQLGFRPKLDDLAAATLGRRKSGDGLEAIRLYKLGQWDALARYCLDDVRITKDIYEYGLTHGFVKFPMKERTIREVEATWVPVPVQARMF